MSLCIVLIVEKTENARRKPMDDFIVVHDGQEGRNDFTIVKRKDNMKDEEWVDAVGDAVEMSPRQRYQALNYMELDDDTLKQVRDGSRKEWDRRQKERFEDLKSEVIFAPSDLEIRKEIQGE